MNELDPEELRLAMYDFKPPCMAEAHDQDATAIAYYRHIEPPEDATHDDAFSVPVCTKHALIIMAAVSLNKWNGRSKMFDCDVCGQPMMFDKFKDIPKKED